MTITVRFYDIRVKEPGFGTRTWGRFFLTSDGSLTIQSDYGNYAYWWTHPGCEIRRFLCRDGEDDYIANKFSEGERVCDDDASVRNVKREILRLRREGTLSRDQARDEWDLLREHDELSDQVARTRWHDETRLGEHIGMVSELFVYVLPYKLQGFMRVLWPAFVEALEREMREEFQAKGRAWFGRAA